MSTPHGRADFNQAAIQVPYIAYDLAPRLCLRRFHRARACFEGMSICRFRIIKDEGKFKARCNICLSIGADRKAVHFGECLSSKGKHRGTGFQF